MKFCAARDLFMIFLIRTSRPRLSTLLGEDWPFEDYYIAGAPSDDPDSYRHFTLSFVTNFQPYFRQVASVTVQAVFLVGSKYNSKTTRLFANKFFFSFFVTFHCL